MPELPEVETIKRDLTILIGSPLKAIIVYDEAYLERNRITPKELKKIEGEKLLQLSRKGKYLFFHFSKNIFGFHLGLTGSLILLPKENPLDNFKHKVLSLNFLEMSLLFSDMRKFGKLFLFNEEKNFQDFLINIGHDALEIEFSEFKEALRSIRKPIKSALLDQKVISGIGNIYADEILFRAGINPLRPASSLSDEELQKLYQTMKEVLHLAIRLRGSTIKDYVDGLGRAGMFQTKHLVYQKYGKPCPRCGEPIEKIKVVGRTTCYCPQCQR
jgi:formamidopyrimidine-DNA glycosylase